MCNGTEAPSCVGNLTTTIKESFKPTQVADAFKSPRRVAEHVPQRRWPPLSLRFLGSWLRVRSSTFWPLPSLESTESPCRIPHAARGASRLPLLASHPCRQSGEALPYSHMTSYILCSDMNPSPRAETPLQFCARHIFEVDLHVEGRNGSEKSPEVLPLLSFFLACDSPQPAAVSSRPYLRLSDGFVVGRLPYATNEPMMRFVYQASLFAASSFSKYCSDGVSHSVSLAWVSAPLSCEQTGSMSQLFLPRISVGQS